MELAVDLQIGALLALILAETAREANRSIGPLALRILLQHGENLGVPPGETGTAKTDHDLYNILIGGHGSPLLEHFH
jgi:hypothetical protein